MAYYMMYDTIVVGGGPAGSVASMELAKRGYNVVLLERFKFPRFKVCAGGIGYRLWRRFKNIVEDGVPIKGALLAGPSGFSVTIDAGEILAYDVSRDVFDSRLVELAISSGVELKEETYVTNVKILSDRAKVFTKKGTFEGRSVIGADGVNSLVAKSLGLRPANWFEDIGFCVVSLVPRRSPEDELIHEFYLGVMGEGYGWTFPHVDHLNIGLGTLRKNFKNPKRDFVDFITKYSLVSKKVKRVPEKIMGFYIPANGMLRKLYTTRALLVGDAGGFVNTMTGEGLNMAIKTAEVATDVISNALDEDDLSEVKLSEYQRRVERDPEIGEELRIGRLLRGILFKNVGLLEDLLKLSSGDRELLNLFLDIIYVRKPYPKIVKHVFSKIPIKVALKFFMKSPKEIITMRMNGGDPYMPPPKR